MHVPASAAERKGIQPVVHLKVNGGERAEVAVGEAVTFTAQIEVPPAPGKVVSAEWDFEGVGTYPDAAELDDPTSETVHVTATHAFSKPGTYFPALRVASQREGNPSTPFARSLNLSRVRVWWSTNDESLWAARPTLRFRDIRWAGMRSRLDARVPAPDSGDRCGRAACLAAPPLKGTDDLGAHRGRAFCSLRADGPAPTEAILGWIPTLPGLPAGTEMPDEERLGRVVLEDGHLDVTPRVDVEGLVSRANGIEESETCIVGDQLVVPLEEEQDRHA